MRALVGRAVFTVGPDQYFGEDVVLAAALWGDWTRVETAVRHGVACLKRMEDVGEPSNPGETERAANAFRYSRDLVLAEETNAWLTEWGLTAKSWFEYFQRSTLRGTWASQLTEILARYPVTDAEVDERLVCEALCSGGLARVARDLAARAAAAAEVTDTSEPGLEGQRQTAQSAIRLCTALGLSSDSCVEKVGRLLRLERCFQAFSSRMVTDAALRAQIDGHRLDWFRVDCQSVSLRDEQVAREAALCVREDGRPLSEVAGEVRTELRNVSFYLDKVEPRLRHHFLGAKAGDLVGPIAWDDGFALFLLLDKTPPSLADAPVRTRAEQSVLDRAIEHAIQKCVKWHARL